VLGAARHGLSGVVASAAGGRRHWYRAATAGASSGQDACAISTLTMWPRSIRASQWSGGSVPAETSCPQPRARPADSPQGWAGWCRTGTPSVVVTSRAPVWVQQEVEAVAVDEGVVPAAHQDEVRRTAADAGAPMIGCRCPGFRDADATVLLNLFCSSSGPVGPAWLLVDQARNGRLIGCRASLALLYVANCMSGWATPVTGAVVRQPND
jgi:hypothetical protein